MEAIKDLILGDPLYDCKGRVIRRNFGIKNIFIILVIVYGLYSLRGKMGIKSGRRKLRGGSESDSTPSSSESDSTPSTGERKAGTEKKNSLAGLLNGLPYAIVCFILYLMLRQW